MPLLLSLKLGNEKFANWYDMLSGCLSNVKNNYY